MWDDKNARGGRAVRGLRTIRGEKIQFGLRQGGKLTSKTDDLIYIAYRVNACKSADDQLPR